MATVDPCTSTATSGLDGAVYCGGQRVARVTQWSIDASVDEKTWHDSGGGGTYSAQGYMNRAPGIRNLTGTVDFKYDTTYRQDARFREGECCQLVLMVDDDVNVAWIIGEALVSRFTMTVNIEDGEVVEGSFDFGNNGRYWRPGEAGAPVVFPLPASPT